MTLKDQKMDVNVRPATVQNPTGKEFSLSVTLWGWETSQVRRIVTRHLPAWLELFERKNREYGEQDASSGTALGVKGQFADIWRKIGKLKTALWDDHEDQLTTEGVDEIAMDLIGHLFLLLDMRAEDRAVPGHLLQGRDSRFLLERAEGLAAGLATQAKLDGLPAPDPETVVMRTRPPVFEPGDYPGLRSARVSDGIHDAVVYSKSVIAALDEIIDNPGSGIYTSYNWVDDDRTISKGDRVEFRHHLHKGGTYEVLGFDSRQEDGMVAHVAPEVDRGEIAIPIWVNPDHLVHAPNDEKSNSDEATAGTKGCENKLTIGHVQASTPAHLATHHHGEAITF